MTSSISDCLHILTDVGDLRDVTCLDTTIGAVKLVIDRVVELMYAHDGVGIAAPQLGLAERFFVIDPTSGYVDGTMTVVINPRILHLSSEKNYENEGCLSLPGVSKRVWRHDTLVAEYVNISGELIVRKFSGLEARIFQHEFDHLNGVLFVDV